jgi:peptidoglycan/LPS O-acetylase OafA/YrhL
MYAILTTDATLPKHLFFFAASGLGAGLIMLAYALEPSVRTSRVAVWLADYLGKISYSAYLFHLAVWVALAPFAGGLPLAVQLAIFLAGLLVVTTTFFYLVEEPILRHRPSLRPRPKTRTSTALEKDGTTAPVAAASPTG